MLPKIKKSAGLRFPVDYVTEAIFPEKAKSHPLLKGGKRSGWLSAYMSLFRITRVRISPQMGNGFFSPTK